jgi:hypothetical protein
MALEFPAMEIPARTLPPDGSVWVVDSPDDLEGREVEVRVPDGTTKRYLVDHAERLEDGMLSVSLMPAGQLIPWMVEDALTRAAFRSVANTRGRPRRLAKGVGHA